LFIHHQVHFVYVRRFLDIHGSKGFTTYLEAVMQIQERAYLQMFDGVVVFSDNDRQALESYVPPRKLHVSPFPIPADVGLTDKVPAKFDGRFVFVASEDHSPNRDALEWLLAKIWPEISRQLPAARLAVIGKWSRTTQNKLSVKGLEFRGFVGDLPATIRGGIMLVPLRIGSGIRVKIMVALAQGVPVLTTLMGCEGMPVIDDIDLLVREVSQEFAAAAVNLARTPELYFRLAMAGKCTASKHYSPAEVRRRRNEIYDSVVQDARDRN
jgi:glycosyltransferase involved in cell wall biosynthesis